MTEQVEQTTEAAQAAHKRAVSRYHRDLEQLPDLYTLLQLFEIPGGSAGSGDGPSGQPTGSRPPMNADVTDLLDEREKDSRGVRDNIQLAADTTPWVWYDRDDKPVDEPARRRVGVLPTLRQWARTVEGELIDDGHHDHPEYGLEPCTRTCTEVPNRARTSNQHGPCDENLRRHTIDPTLAYTCSWLLTHTAWTTEQDWFPTIADEIHQLHRDIRTAIRDHGVEDLHLTCMNPGCGWTPQEMDGGSWYRCPGCGQSWSRIELHKHAERRRPRRLSECAQAVDIPVRWLRSAVDDGTLKHVGRDGNARLYDLQDAAAIAAQVKLHQAREEATR